MNKLKTSIRISELDTLSGTLVRLYKDSKIGDAFLSTTFAELERLSVALSAAIKMDRVLSNLDDADALRDDWVKRLGDAISGYSMIPVESKNAAAEKVAAVFGKYGKSIIGKSYAEESSLIGSLLTDLSAESLVKPLEELEGVSGIIDSLREAQKAFSVASDAFTAANLGKGESASSIKKAIQSLVNEKVIPYLSAMLISEPVQFGDFVAKVESEVKKANDGIAARSKRAKKQSADTPAA